MVIGRKSYIIGHFAPTKADPVLRLIFPRDAESTVKASFSCFICPVWRSPSVRWSFA
jgi:hypothetical protein